MMTLWCIFGSPMMLGAELTLLDQETLALLTNREVLHLLNSDCHARQVRLDDDCAVWTARDTKTGDVYAALFNLSDETATVSVQLEELTETFGLSENDEDSTVSVTLHDLWSGCDTNTTGTTLSSKLITHACVIWKILRH